jgi:lauroyl/myristoyl acyltransferase
LSSVEHDRPWRATFADHAAVSLYRVAGLGASVVPTVLARPVVEVAAVSWSRLRPARRALVRRHLERILAWRGRSRDADLERLVDEAFRSYARYWLDALSLPALDPDRLDVRVDAEGFEHVMAARALGRGVVVALPHLGGWDVGGAWLVHRGIPLTVVAEVLEPPGLFDLFVKLRERVGMRVVPLGPRAMAELAEALARNDVVALVCDRDLTREGIEVELFGERTTLPPGPVLLALRRNCPLLPVAIYAERDGRHRALIRPPVELERTGRLRADVVAGLQRLAKELELLIAEAPEQWHVFQPNWPSERCSPGEMER